MPTNPISRDIESQPLLTQSPATTPSRLGALKSRSISQASIAFAPSNRWWTLTTAALVTILVGAIVGGILSSADVSKHHAEEPKPDWTVLPPPAPGLRNPSYLVSGHHGAVASEVGLCSQVGVEVLKEGGTATDAGIATTLCIGTTNMFSSGIGGGGFLVIKPSSTHLSLNPRCREPIAIDFRETAPAGAFSTMYAPRLNDSTFDSVLASKVGGLAVAVPGELRGLEEAYKLCGGGVSWQRLVQPAADIAKASTVGNELGRRLAFSKWMLSQPLWASIFAPHGQLLVAGDILRRENYSRTLETIGREGADIFYHGAMAKSMVKTVRDAGGILTLKDLADYKVNISPALHSTYLNRTYYTAQAPSGGPVIISLLNTLETYQDFVREGRTGLAIHRFVEALKFAFSARTELGDPAFIHNGKKLREILTKSYAAEVRRNITDDRTHELAYYHPHFDIKEDHGTTHLSVIDQWGSAISITSTVNLLFGSQVMDESTGIIMNDEMDDFATPGISDAFGLAPSPFNYPAPGKRPLSSTAPLIMDHFNSNETWLAIGGSGGSRIFPSVTQVIMNLDWGYDLDNSVQQPRVHDQLSPARVSIESGFRPDFIEALSSRGHNVSLFDINLGIAEVQAVTKTGDLFFAASDSRKNGVPAAY